MTHNTAALATPADVTPNAAATMTAVVQGPYGRPQDVLQLAEMERPRVGGDDVLIRVRATSVNTPDLVVVSGEPRILRLKTGLRRPGTAIRGSDVAGVVAEVGANVTELRVGDEVFGSVWDNEPVQQHGTFADYTVVPAAQVVTKPAGLGFAEAAASVMSGLTALNAVRDVGQVSPGMRVLVNGASGGVGTMAVQIAAALGAEVTGVCSTRNVELVRSLGAHDVIDYTTSDYTQRDERYDVVLDNVMNHPPAATARVVAPGGVFIPNSIGTSGGLLGGMPRTVRATLLGRRGTPRVGMAACVVNQENLAALTTLLAAGDVRAVIDATYALEDAAEAVAHMLGHHAAGKVAITV